MNFLAHAYLSFGHPQILVGNMVSDFIKGRIKEGYPNDVRQGILLHRAIDAFTDSHPATREAKEVFRADYRLYSGAIVDILYDHFLACDLDIFSEASLQQFTSIVYETLEENAAHLPPHFLQVLFYMRSENWLFHYRTPEGISRSLRGLVRRAAYIHDSAPAIVLFETHYDHLQQCYRNFFPDVKQFAKQQVDQLL